MQEPRPRNGNGYSPYQRSLSVDETVCKFTEPDFPPEKSWPPKPGRPVEKKCHGILRQVEIDPNHGPMGPFRGGCYETTDTAKSVSVAMTMDVACFCGTCKGFGENRDSITLKAKKP